MGDFTDAVERLRADLDENPMTKSVISNDQALCGYKAAMDAALGRGSCADHAGGAGATTWSGSSPSIVPT
jgi:hypothetical protein